MVNMITDCPVQVWHQPSHYSTLFLRGNKNKLDDGTFLISPADWKTLSVHFLLALLEDICNLEKSRELVGPVSFSPDGDITSYVRTRSDKYD